MNCPVCAASPLTLVQSPREPDTHACPSCRGRFLLFNDHLTWLERSGLTPTLPVPPAAAQLPPLPPEPPRKPRMCPRCSRMLTRFRISLDLPFTLDRCSTCAGVWFDEPEWPTVLSAGFLPGLHHLFNDTHQHKLELEERRRLHEARCRAIVGHESFEKASAFKHWLDAHPHKDALLAFLEDRPEPQSRPTKPFRTSPG